MENLDRLGNLRADLWMGKEVEDDFSRKIVLTALYHAVGHLILEEIRETRQGVSDDQNI